MKIRKDDKVKVLYGKDAGKVGTVVSVDIKKMKVLVSGVNEYVKHQKGDGKGVESGIVKINKPLPVAKVILICPNCEKSTRIGYRIENDKKVRYCKKCNKSLMTGVDVKKEDKKSSKKKVKVSKKDIKKSMKKDMKKLDNKKAVNKRTVAVKKVDVTKSVGHRNVGDR
ncbi:MAG TPA: 50S ribosomal protein L24 [bacterium]|nr:50S ribosomal protein L24 [bacterium]